MPAGGPFVDHHCHSLVRAWHRVGGGPWPAWRRCFTEAVRPASLAADAGDLLGYRHFLAELAGLLGLETAGPFAGRADPQGARPTDLRGTRRADAPGSRTAESPGSRPADPQGIRPADPQGIRPVDPQGTRPADPQGTRPGGPGARGVGWPGALEELVVARRDQVAGDDPDGHLRRLLDDAGTAALLVDTGFGSDMLEPAALERAAARPVHPVVRVEAVAEAVLAGGGPAARTLGGFVAAFEERVGRALDEGAVALKSIAAYRGGLALAGSTAQERRDAFGGLDRAAQAARFDDPVLEPFLVRRAAELAATRGTPLQFHTGFGDEDLDLRLADPTLLRPLLRDPRTEACPVVLLHCYPFVGQAAYLAGTYPQVFMDLSLTVPLAEPVAAGVVREALGLCPTGKLLAASDGHSFPEMHWWGAVVWRRALHGVLAAEVERGALDDAAAATVAGQVLAGNAARLYRI